MTESEITRPFLFQRHSEEELSDYHEGFTAGAKGQQVETNKSMAWRSGWTEGQDCSVEFRWY
jgi:hypothetical protein